jgi:transposase-like protein
MKNNTTRKKKKQGFCVPARDAIVRDLIVNGKAELRQGLLELCIRSGFMAMAEMLHEEITALCGGRYEHGLDRQAYRWGATGGEVVLGGRKVKVKRPRVRDFAGQEVLPGVYRYFRNEDRLSEQIIGQLLAGVSGRQYRESLETGECGLVDSGSSRSSVSRRFIAGTGQKVKAWLDRSLENLRFVALFIDGIKFGAHTVIVALGVDEDGCKHILGVWEGSSENTVVCQSLLDNLASRKFPVDKLILVVIDGSKALRSAVLATFGNNGAIQRCQYHKRQNVKGHLPKKMHRFVDQTMMQAYECTDGQQARAILHRLINTLKDAYPGAARSLEEGLDETLTVIDLGLPKALRQSLQTTNVIESPFSVVRQVARNVKRWRSGNMAERWAALGLMEAEKRFRKINGHGDMPVLIQALIKRKKALDKGAVA